MYELVLRTQFSAAHQLRHYHGKCEQLHGHNWDIEIVLTKNKLSPLGMVIDFVEAKKIIEQTTGRLDHTYLNNLKEFQRLNPTTENLAGLIFKDLKVKFRKKRIKVTRVGVWESPRAGAYYFIG